MKNVTSLTAIRRFWDHYLPSFISMAKILIADDSRLHVHLVSAWLNDRGFQIVTSFDSVQASMNAVRIQPDLIVLDLNMPGGSGVDVLKRLKASNKTKDIPIIVITGTGGREMRDFVRRLGAADLLEKPLDREQFCRIVQDLVPRGTASTSCNSTTKLSPRS
jgi:CheY-like chemotaxis protein